MTHNPSARSWLASANQSGGAFPLQNLPFAVFRHARSAPDYRGGVAIGDQIIDLRVVRDLFDRERLFRFTNRATEGDRLKLGKNLRLGSFFRQVYCIAFLVNYHRG